MILLLGTINYFLSFQLVFKKYLVSRLQSGDARRPRSLLIDLVEEGGREVLRELAVVEQQVVPEGLKGDLIE